MSSYPRCDYFLQDAGLAGQEHGKKIFLVPLAVCRHLTCYSFLRFRSTTHEDMAQSESYRMPCVHRGII